MINSPFRGERVRQSWGEGLIPWCDELLRWRESFMQIRFYHSLGLRMPPHPGRSDCESVSQLTGPPSPPRRGLLWIRNGIAGLTLIAVFCLRARAQPQADATNGEFWPAADFHIQLPDNYRLLGFVESKRGEDFPYQQLDLGIGLGYQWKKIRKPHFKNIDPDKEFMLVLAGGYEYLRTLQAGKNTSYENRLVLEAFPGFRPASRLLIRDRNRVEFNWTNGVYSTVYRNDLALEYDIRVGKFRLTPYASAEFFYDAAKHSWNEEQYTGGVQWPYKRLLMLETYYLRQNCTTCGPAHLNVAGLTLNFYFRNAE